MSPMQSSGHSVAELSVAAKKWRERFKQSGGQEHRTASIAASPEDRKTAAVAESIGKL